jgi:hypothetical protein
MRRPEHATTTADGHDRRIEQPERPRAGARRETGVRAETRDWQALPDIGELLRDAQDTARGMQEAEEALGSVRLRFEQAHGPEAQGQLAAEALDHVERQLSLTRDRRRRLDSFEAKLWARRNRIERLLIHARGSGWWRARRSAAPAEAASK